MCKDKYIAVDLIMLTKCKFMFVLCDVSGGFEVLDSAVCVYFVLE